MVPGMKKRTTKKRSPNSYETLAAETRRMAAADRNRKIADAAISKIMATDMERLKAEYAFRFPREPKRGLQVAIRTAGTSSEEVHGGDEAVVRQTERSPTGRGHSKLAELLHQTAEHFASMIPGDRPVTDAVVVVLLRRADPPGPIPEIDVKIARGRKKLRSRWSVETEPVAFAAPVGKR